ncbi:GNAT family N-acetyltransferase [Paenibacillus sp. YPG26]|uniref:GNAT family N-acetyltransferase n=1 Tax=Paenibacillus sp. YPG26 TaxID=2878915 RepID=UPI00203EB304|nr:GNAT family N-acetyltransferase [Paenibacillus sp. YPG26]USB32925.1 GNAT family N-acetyltransferase [Paenibacillus sp. YPG26]
MRFGQTLIRVSELRDAAELIEIDKLVWSSETTPAELAPVTRESFLQQNPPGSQLVAVIEERICGYLGFYCPTPLQSNGHVYEINIAVHPSYQRQGIGRALMDGMKQHAARQGIRKLCLRVLATNGKALEFYRSCGFMEQGRLVEEFYLGGRYVDDILLWYPLKQPKADEGQEGVKECP